MDALSLAGFRPQHLYVNGNGEIFVFTTPLMLLHAQMLDADLQENLIMRAVPAVASVEYRRQQLPYFLDCTFLASAEPVVPDDALDRMTEFDLYPKAPPGLRDIYQVHPVFVVKLDPSRVNTLWAIYKINSTMVDYEYAAIFLWWVLLPHELYQFFLDTRLHLVHYAEQGGLLSELFEVCRQQAACCKCDIGAQAFFWLRKYKNLFGRRKGVCDVAQEEERYKPYYSYRRLSNIGIYPDRKTYLYSFMKHVRRVTDAIVVQMRTAQLDDLETWWKKRVNNLASGSSSNRHLLDEYILKDERIRSSDRPNKKAVCEVYDDNYIQRLLCQMPHMIARRSTKNEPGLKQRALYAVDDNAVIVSAFASMSIEKNMSIMGMAPLQRPVDVLKWWKDGQQQKKGEIWLSADYTDFNKEHSQIELEILNLSFARSWLLKYPVAKVARQKSFCAMWLAEAQRCRFVKDENGNIQRVFSALFSGSRDTARDNTILHQVYHNMVLEWLDVNLKGWGSVVSAHMCGDDEDVLFSDHLAAAMYYQAIKSIGWHTNDSKQMCGVEHHEFLQKMPHTVKGCLAPISSMIAALCSGQWYTQPGLQQDSATAAISDQIWELIVRGGEARKLYHLAVDILNDYMQVRRAKEVVQNKAHGDSQDDAKSTTGLCNNNGNSTTIMEKKKLEWWKYRLGGAQIPNVYLEKASIIPNNTTFLWLGTKEKGDGTLEANAPKPFFYVQYSPKLPHRASQAWCDRWRKTFEEYGKLKMFPNYVLSMKANSFGSLYHTYWQDLKRNWLWDKWPERTTQTEQALAKVTGVENFVYECHSSLLKNNHEIKLLLLKQSTRVQHRTIQQQLASRGADSIMFELLGGEKNLDLMNKLGIVKTSKERMLSWLDLKPHLFRAHTLLDPALRSFLTTAGPN